MTVEVVAVPKKTVSHSEVDQYLRCERAHYYGYGLGIQRIAESDSLNRGIMGHATLEVFFRGLLAGKDFEVAKQEMYDYLAPFLMSQTVLASEIMDCLHWFFLDYPFAGWTVLAVEQEYVLEVTDTLAMPFVVDLIAQDKFGEVWIIDHKFVYDFVNDRDAELLPQLAKYAAALKILGVESDHVAFSSLRYRHLKTPSIDSKYQLTIFKPTTQRLRRTIVEQMYASQRVQERKMLPLSVQSETALRTGNKMVCNSCSFRSLCVAELNDHQPQLILDSEYMKRERREFKTKEIEGTFLEIEVD